MFVYVFGNNKVTFPCFSSYCLFACLTNISEVRKIVPFSTLPQAPSLSVFLMPLFLLRHQSQFTRVDRVTYTLEIHFLIVLEAGHPGPKCRPGCSPMRPPSLACRRLPSCCLFTEFPLCSHTLVPLCALNFFFFQDTSWIGLGLTLMISV